MEEPLPLQLEDEQVQRLLFPRPQCKRPLGVLKSTTMAEFLRIAGEQRQRFRGVTPVDLSNDYNLFTELHGLWRATRSANMDRMSSQNSKQLWGKHFDLARTNALLSATGAAIRRRDRMRNVPLAESAIRLRREDEIYIDIASSSLYMDFTTNGEGTMIPAGESMGPINPSALQDLLSINECQLQILEFKAPDGEFVIDFSELFPWLSGNDPTLQELINMGNARIQTIAESGEEES